MTNALPGWTGVFIEQLAFLGRGRRREIALLVLCALGFLLLSVFPSRLPTLLALELEGEGAEATVEFRWIKPEVLDFFDEPRLVVHLLAYEILFLLGLLWPLSVWRGEGPRRRDDFWTMPVSRPAHEAARVVAGAVWLMGMCAVTLTLTSLGIVLGGNADALGHLSPLAWTHFFTGPLTFYLLATVAALRSEHPGRTLCWVMAVLFVPFAFFGAIELESGFRVFLEVIGGEFSYSAALSAPIEDILEKGVTRRQHMGAATCLWLGLGVAAVAAALRRAHDT